MDRQMFTFLFAQKGLTTTSIQLVATQRRTVFQYIYCCVLLYFSFNLDHVFETLSGHKPPYLFISCLCSVDKCFQPWPQFFLTTLLTAYNVQLNLKRRRTKHDFVVTLFLQPAPTVLTSLEFRDFFSEECRWERHVNSFVYRVELYQTLLLDQ